MFLRKYNEINLCVDTTFWQKVCLSSYRQGMRESRFDELCGLWQIAVSWVVYLRSFRFKFTTSKISKGKFRDIKIRDSCDSYFDLYLKDSMTLSFLVVQIRFVFQIYLIPMI
jgi:hypothetical protein